VILTGALLALVVLFIGGLINLNHAYAKKRIRSLGDAYVYALLWWVQLLAKLYHAVKDRKQR
jgi:hypothetical protein